MNNLLKDQYNSLYSSGDDVFYGGKSAPVVTRIPQYCSSGRVLDAGGGEGRNALFLARAGFSVTVCDLSEVGLHKIEETAAAEQLAINTIESDLLEYQPDGIYDVVIFTFVLHHVNTSDIAAVFERYQAFTNKSGLHCIATYTAEGALAERNYGKGRWYPTEAEVRALYDGWEIIELLQGESVTRARHKDGSQMKNNLLTLLSRKTAQ